MTRPNFKDALREWIDSPDPVLESVVAYHEGRLDAADREAFEARLEDDEGARELLAELRVFEAAELGEGESESASEFEVAATMRTLRHGAESSAGASEAGSVSRGGVPAARTSGPAVGSWAAAAALAMLSFGLGWVGSGARSGSPVEGAGLGPAQIHHLAADSELRSGDNTATELRATAARQVLVVTPQETLETDRELRCAIFEVGAGDPVIGPVPLRVGEHGIVVLSFEQPLPAGDYELRLTDPVGGEPIESLPFRWNPVLP